MIRDFIRHDGLYLSVLRSEHFIIPEVKILQQNPVRQPHLVRVHFIILTSMKPQRVRGVATAKKARVPIHPTNQDIFLRLGRPNVYIIVPEIVTQG
jgi:hypothetical protein